MIKQIKHAPEPPKNKLLGLEVIRFTSALSVLVWHYQHFFYVADKPVDFLKEKQPLYPLLGLFYDYGLYGVQVFWCISGFIFFWKYREAIASSAITYKQFFVLRFSRLYPLHFLTLMLVLVLQAYYFSKQDYFFVYQNNDLAHFIFQLFLASNWGFEKGVSFNGPIWSISVEVLIYVCFFLILQKISRSYLVNIGILLLCVGAKYLKAPSPIFDCFAFFYIGGLSAILYRHIQKTRYKTFFSRLSLALLLVTPAFIYVSKTYRHEYFPLVFLLTYVPILLFFCAQNFNASPAVQKTIEAAGNMTYSSYLMHFPLQLLISIYYLNISKAIPYYSNTFFIGFILVTLFVSYWIYRLFELPAQNYLRRRLG